MSQLSITSVTNADESIGSGFGGTVTYTLTLSESEVNAVTVNYRGLSGTAIDRIDFPATSGTVTFAPGETVQTVDIRVNSDNVDETDEAFVLEFYDPVGTEFAGGAKVIRETAFALDDDGAGANLSVFVSSPVIVEGDNGSQQAVFTIDLSQPSGSSITLAYATADGSAQAGSDYTATSGNVTFAPGQTSATVSVPVSGDGSIEPSEFFHLNVTPTGDIADGGLGASGMATVLDDDGAGGLPTISVEATNAYESIGSGFGGTSYFTVTLSEASANAVTVGYEAYSGTGISQVDFPFTQGELTFAPGETSKTVDVRVTSDNVDETDESFVMQFFDPTNAGFEGDAKVLRETSFVLDSDGVGPNRALHVSSPVVVEGDSGTTRVDFDVTLSQPSTTTITLNYETVPGSASAGSDFTTTTGQVTFAPGQTKASVTVEASGDAASEPSEYFSLHVTPTADIADGSLAATGVATLIDDDGADGLPTISVEATNADESIGSGFGGEVFFIVTLSEASANAVNVGYRGLPATAIDQNDYPFSGDVLTFAPGETSKTINLRVTSDNVDEADESFIYEFFEPENATFGGGVPVLRETSFILDDDGVGPNLGLHVSSPMVTEGEDGNTRVDFDVTLSRPSTDTITLNYATADGSATDGSDYTATSGTLTFLPGQTKATVTVAANGDRTAESSETFFLNITPSLEISDGGVGASGMATLIDDDSGAGLPTISVEATNALESIGSGFGGTSYFTVTLSEASTNAVTVDYNSFQGSAIESTDYPALAGTLTFAPGETSKVIPLRVTSDSVDEADEAFFIELKTPTNAVFNGNATVLRETAFVLDDDGVGPNLAFAVSSVFVPETRDGDPAYAEFEVTLSRPQTFEVELSYQTNDDTALAGSDYVAQSGTLRFEPGQTTAVIVVPILSDAVSEQDEMFSLSFGNTPNFFDSGFTGAFATATISDTVVDTGDAPSESDDNIIGTAASETLSGLGGNDVLFGAGGDDIINGGEGMDTARYSGDQAAYTVTLSANGTTIEDRRTDADGTDTLQSVEGLVFNDAPWLLDIFDGVTGLSQADFNLFVEVYIAYFNRAPDAQGLFFYGTAFANGTSLEDAAQTFVNSSEYAETYAPDLTNLEFATEVYQNVLGRSPDQLGLDFWVPLLDAGTVSTGFFIVEVLKGAQAPSPADAPQDFIDQKLADQAYLKNKTDLGVYFSVTRGMSDVDNAEAAFAAFDGSEASINSAVSAIDGFYTDALAADTGEFLLNLVGVVDNPFEV